MEELASRYQFQHHIDRVLGLEHAFQLEKVGVRLRA